ncbi:MAG: hypothetical protein AAFX06_10235 [Planctomycetota bacterium]
MLSHRGSRSTELLTAKLSKYKSRYLTDEKPLRLTAHRDLVRYVETYVTNARVRNELLMAFRRSLQTSGRFKIHLGRFQACEGGSAAKELRRHLRECPFIRKVEGPVLGQRATTYEFRLVGRYWLKNPKNARSTDSGNRCISFSRPYRSTVDVCGRWLLVRHRRWTEWCEKNGYESKIDFDGSTEIGQAAKNGLEALTVDRDRSFLADIEPGVDDSEKRRYASRFLHSMWNFGRFFCVYRKDGRTYIPTTNCPKSIRHNSLRMEGEWVGEADLGASYWYLLATQLRPGRERDRLLELIHSGGFYEAIAEAAGIEFTDRETLKQEVQRQCLFGRDWRLSSRPLWRGLRRLLPELCCMIEDYRRWYGVSGFARFLMRLEGRLMDAVWVTLHRRGIVSLRNHDGMLAAESWVAQVRDTIIELGVSIFGIAPRVSIKTGAKHRTLGRGRRVGGIDTRAAKGFSQ